MEQLSFLDNSIIFPLTHEDVINLYQRYIFEGEEDTDVFTFADTAKGKSYFFYGKKVFEHTPGTINKARLYLPFEDEEGKQKFKPKKASDLPNEQLRAVLNELKEKKRLIFRNLVEEVFACCNDYILCSDERACIHAKDRFYNGCTYRSNLESGIIFYGKNKNA